MISRSFIDQPLKNNSKIYKDIVRAVARAFWKQYTSLGAQKMCPKIFISLLPNLKYTSVHPTHFKRN